MLGRIIRYQKIEKCSRRLWWRWMLGWLMCGYHKIVQKYVQKLTNFAPLQEDTMVEEEVAVGAACG